MIKRLDLVGKKFGKLTVIKDLGDAYRDKRKKHKASYWLCKCDCGKEHKTKGSALTAGQIKSCGCWRIKDLTGKKFHYLTVLNRIGNDKNKKSLWKCKCECGNYVVIVSMSLINGKTKSCGCWRKERIIETQRKDLTGRKFGDWTVLNYYNTNKNVKTIWKCICRCGHTELVIGQNLLNGKSKRCNECKIQRMSMVFYGPNSPTWKGGISCEPYCDAWADKEYKEDIKARDNYECQNPDCWKTGAVLCLHHVDYDKKNCAPTNLISICKSCNARANFNREWYTRFYRKILIKKEGYEYERIIKRNVLST